MTTLEYCLANADAMADEVLESWTIHFRNVGVDQLPADFKALLDLAIAHQKTKDATAREAFCNACVKYQDKNQETGKKSKATDDGRR